MLIKPLKIVNHFVDIQHCLLSIVFHCLTYTNIIIEFKFNKFVRVTYFLLIMELILGWGIMQLRHYSDLVNDEVYEYYFRLVTICLIVDYKYIYTACLYIISMYLFYMNNIVLIINNIFHIVPIYTYIIIYV